MNFQGGMNFQIKRLFTFLYNKKYLLDYNQFFTHNDFFLTVRIEKIAFCKLQKSDPKLYVTLLIFNIFIKIIKTQTEFFVFLQYKIPVQS